MMAEKRSKHLYLVRHSESVNNKDKEMARAMLSTWQLPSTEQLKHATNLLKFDFNSPLSAKGKLMLELQRRVLDESDFVRSKGIQLILHSELDRARDTCCGLFGRFKDEVPIKPHPLLYEKSFTEYVVADLSVRVASFKRELFALEEEHIVLVGHSGFFRKLLGTDKHLKNCEVFHCILYEDGSVDGACIVHEGGRNLVESLM
jgi:broad specificity phosphatase PhoE